MTYSLKPALAAITLATALLGTAAPACANTLEQIMQQKVLRVAIDLSAPLMA